MIELEKEGTNESYSEQEVQDFVNRVYDYAASLRLNSELSWEMVCEELVNQGINREDAQVVVDNLREQEHNARKIASKKEIGYGLLWALGGVLLTVISDWKYIFWGAVVWGIWLILKGINGKEKD